MSGNNIIYNSKEIIENVLTNILNMLRRRKVINHDKPNKYYIDKLDISSEKNIYELELQNDLKMSVYFVNTKLNSITNGSPLSDYLDSNINIHKIIIVKDVAKKVIKQIVSDYKNAEVFFETELMIDIGIIVFIPEHQLLLKEEKEELLKKIPERNIAHIFTTDRMAREYNANVGDIFRIIRPSIVAGKNIFYRRVIAGSWDLIM